MIKEGQIYRSEFHPGKEWHVIGVYEDRVWVRELNEPASIAPQWMTMMQAHFEEPFVFLWEED